MTATYHSFIGDIVQLQISAKCDEGSLVTHLITECTEEKYSRRRKRRMMRRRMRRMRRKRRIREKRKRMRRRMRSRKDVLGHYSLTSSSVLRRR